MTSYTRHGDVFSVTSDAALDLHRELPVGTYTVVYDDMRGAFLLKMVENVTLPPKLYGDTTSNTDRILRTFLDREVSTGVLLVGEKGSGKSLLAKNLSVNAREAGIPTIIINSEFVGDGFNQFIQSIDQEAIILFDEFEKTYRREKQEALLTLFDGVFPTKKMFILTVNDVYRIDSNITNRPGRMYYNIEFKGLTADFVKEYAEECLVNKSQVSGLVAVSGLFPNFNFDMLKALVEEMNRYGETAAEAARLLNVKTKDAGDLRFEASITLGGIEYLDYYGAPLVYSGNPFTGRTIEFYDVYPVQAFHDGFDSEELSSSEDTQESMPEWMRELVALSGGPTSSKTRSASRASRQVRERRSGSSRFCRTFEFRSEDLVGHDIETGILTYEDDKSGAILTLKKVETRPPRYALEF